MVVQSQQATLQNLSYSCLNFIGVAVDEVFNVVSSRSAKSNDKKLTPKNDYETAVGDRHKWLTIEWLVSDPISNFQKKVVLADQRAM